MSSTLCEIEVEAFKNFAEPTVFRVGALPVGLHFVRGVNRTNERLGSNGAGKSSFFSDAVMWCLYGQTVGGLRTTDIKSWLTKKPPRVAVTIRDGKTERVIQRGPKASALTIDGQTVGQSDVDALIGLDFAAASQAVVWGQGRPLFFDLAPRDKMQILSDALGLDRWERRADVAAARAKRLGTALEGLRGEEIGLGTARDHAELALGEARDASGRWAGGQARKMAELASLASAARSRADDLKARRGEAAMASDRAGTDAKLLRPEVEKDRTRLAALDSAILGHKRTFSTWGEKLEGIESQIRDFEETGACPTCGQAVAKKDAARHVKVLRAELVEIKTKRAALKGDINRDAKAAGKIDARLTEADIRLEKLEAAERTAESDLRALDRELATAQAQAAAARQAQQDAEGEVNPHREAMSVARKRLAEIKADERELAELITKREAAIERAQFWARGFRDIRLMVIDEVLDDLRETTAAVLEDFGLGEWSVDYSTERETKSGTTQRALTVAIRSPTAPEGVRWESYSGGEGQRLRVAGALALSEVLMSRAGAALDFRVLDEPTRGMGGSGVDDLCELLADYARDAGLRIFFVDHLAREGHNFTSTVTIENTNRGGVIKSG